MKTISFSLFICLTAFTYAIDTPLDIIRQNLIKDCGTLSDKVESFEQNVKAQNWDHIERSFFESRNAFKKVELFMAFLDHEFTNDYINGAPLKKLERKTPDLVILEPKGFQIIEEEIMAKNYESVSKLVPQLNERIKEFNARLKYLTLSHRMVFEIIRTGIIRLASLGITGFDTPSGLNTQRECEIAFQALQQTAGYYTALLSPELKDDIETIFLNGLEYFKVKDFDQFNHFQFIQKALNPAYKMALVAQKSLFIETRDMATTFNYSYNYEATNIFDDNFLNASFFVNYASSGNQDKKLELGKMLFYDPILSKNNQRACASCHHPSKGFTDGLPTPLAFDNKGVLTRNAPGLINAVYSTRFFWDTRADNPESQIEHVIFNTKEFNTNYDEIVAKLSQSEAYRALFKDAFPEVNAINRYTIVGSIGSFIQSLRSFNSDFDKLMRSEATISNREDIEKGFNLFTGKAACATCHFIPSFSGLVPPNFTETETEVLGIPNVNDKKKAVLDEDLGRYRNKRPREKAEFYRFSFKTPTVRNIALTAPYMHNGVFPTLKEVVEFYNEGGGHGWGIAPENTTLPEDELNLTSDEIKQLVIFMEALTDTTGMTSKPNQLPRIGNNETLNNRQIGGLY